MANEQDAPDRGHEPEMLCALPPAGSPPLDTEAGARWLCRVVQECAASTMQTEGALNPQAWILARRSPIKDTDYPDGQYAVIAGTCPPAKTGRELDDLFAWIRANAERSAAVGVAFITQARVLALRHTPPPGFDTARAARRGRAPAALYLSLEHRALPTPIHYFALAQRNGRHRMQIFPWQEIAEEDALVGETKALFPRFLPPLN
jgi:hypothetical protein